MGIRIDTRERTEARKAERAASLEGIKLYTLSELEPIINVTHRTLQQYVYDGKIKAVKIGGRWMVSETEVKRFIGGQ